MGNENSLSESSETIYSGALKELLYSFRLLPISLSFHLSVLQNQNLNGEGDKETVGVILTFCVPYIVISS